MIYYLLVLLSFLNYGESVNILAVFNHPGASHTTLGKVLLQELARKGHQVTMISAFPLEKPIPNYRDIYLEGFLEDLRRRNSMYFDNKLSAFEQTKNMSLQHTMDTFRNPEVKKLLASQETFDVILVDYLFNEGTLIFGHHFKAPVIVMSSFGNNILLNSMTGNSLPFSYVPGAALMTSEDMSFRNRVVMTLMNILLPVFLESRMKQHEEMLKIFFKDVPSMDVLKNNIALVFSYSHVSFESPRPYTPNIIPVGGYHVQEEKLAPLPKDLKKFLDDAKEGVVFFSLGSQIKTTDLKAEAFEAISRAFGRLRQKVLWKWEGDDSPKVPKNVRLEKWLPQKEILAHHNVKAFVTHGGILSMIEAIHFSIPMLFIPFNGDQPTNAAFAKSRGLGLILKPEEITEEALYAALHKLINDEKYFFNVAYYSDLLRNQPVKPLDLAVYWVEHVAHHKGAPHLKPFSLRLPWYLYYMLDVISFLFTVIFVTMFIFAYILKKMFNFVCKCKKQRIQKVKKS